MSIEDKCLGDLDVEVTGLEILTWKDHTGRTICKYRLPLDMTWALPPYKKVSTTPSELVGDNYSI